MKSILVAILAVGSLSSVAMAGTCREGATTTGWYSYTGSNGQDRETPTVAVCQGGRWVVPEMANSTPAPANRPCAEGATTTGWYSSTGSNGQDRETPTLA